MQTIEPLVRRWADALAGELPVYQRLMPAAHARGSVLRPGATETDLVALEARLGRPLPPSYRAFLALSDGADAGTAAGWHLRSGIGHEMEMRPATDVVRMLDADRFLLELWADDENANPHPVPEPGADAAAEYPQVRSDPDALLVSTGDQDNIIVIAPGTSVEWEVWTFWHSEILGYASWADYLRLRADQADAFVRERRQLASSALDSDRTIHAVMALLEELGRDAVPTAIDRILDPDRPAWHRSMIAQELGEIGDPRATTGLRAAVIGHQAARPLPGTEQSNLEEHNGMLRDLLVALDLCGDHEFVSTLRSSSDPAIAGAAARHERPQPDW